jgi:ribosome maturation factor RimP
MGALSAAAHPSARGAHSPRRPGRASGTRPETPETGIRRALALTPEIEAELSEVATAAGCELLHVEWKGGVLRLVLDRQPSPAPPASEAGHPRDSSDPSDPGDPGEHQGAAASIPSPSDTAGESPSQQGRSGVSLADCEHVAKQASALLDVMDFGKGRYVLEVSSPGLDRQLYGPRDYQRFLGRLARVTYEVDGTRRTVVGRLAGFQQPAAANRVAAAGEVTLVDERTGERLALPLGTIRLARLEVEL